MIDLRQAPPAFFAQLLAGNLQGIGPSRKLYGHFAEAVELRLSADCVWVVGEDGETWALRGDPRLCDRERTATFLLNERPGPHRTGVLGRVKVHGRLVAVVGAARRSGLGQAARRTLDRLCGVLALELTRREEQRLERVLDRIRGKIVSELRPRDLAYQILDGLHQLVDYDHSSAFLTWEAVGERFRIEAEKIVWMKGKSAFVGYEIPARLPGMLEELSRSPEIRRLSGDDPAAPADPFWEMLDYHRGRGIPVPSSLLCAPLFFAGEFLGLLKIAAWKRRPFDRWDESVVERFLPAAAASIRNARVNMSLELKATMVTLASAVAHDVNNAVGTILPLVQQVREDLAQGETDRQVLDQDLAMVLEKTRLCQRIFSNMLRVARAGGAGDGPVDVNQVVRETLPFFEGQARRRRIETVLELADGLPPVRFSRQDLQHIVLNLVDNSLDALAQGGERAGTAAGELKISTRLAEGGALLEVRDDGPGILPELLEKVQEPFFTTKDGGTGLGLAICRALAWHNGGSLEIDSAPGRGTRVAVGLRLAADPAQAEPPGSGEISEAWE